MSAPAEIERLYDIDETATLTRRSKTWLYHHAGVDIPVTQRERGGRLFWTAAQINTINTAGAIQPQRSQAPARRSSAPPKAAMPKTSASSTRLPVARPDAKRLRRSA